MAHVNTFAGSPIDRAGHLRTDDDWQKAAREAPTTRYLPLWNLRALMATDDPLTISWRNAEDIKSILAHEPVIVFLGMIDEVAHFAIDVSAAGQRRANVPFGEHGKFIDVRSAAMECSMADAAMLAQARSMIDWHARHGFCSTCGKPSALKESGYMRQCPDCNAMHFPRTDPVTIMLVLDGDNALMGRQARFATGSYSALAGFTEPGESIEESVRREVKEEAGLDVGAVRYHSSQPWPFVSNLMIGCYAEALTREIVVDTEELEEARWFTRDEVASMVERWADETAVRMPPPLSIAHQLAKAWLKDG